MPTRRNLPRNQRQLRRERSFLRRRTRLAHARRGASSWTLRLRSWFLHHRRSLAGSLQDLLATPLPTLLSCLAIGIAFALPMMLYIALHNLQALGVEQVDVAEISVFLRRDLDEEQGHRLARRIQEWPTAGSVEYRSREQALEEFRAWSGFGDILDDLEENPLSAVLLVRPADARPDTLSLEALRLDLEALPEVELARAELEWVRRLQRALMLAERLVDLLAILLMGGALLAVANSIRLMIAGRHDEIVVTKMVGAPPPLCAVPFFTAASGMAWAAASSPGRLLPPASCGWRDRCGSSPSCTAAASCSRGRPSGMRRFCWVAPPCSDWRAPGLL